MRIAETRFRKQWLAALCVCLYAECVPRDFCAETAEQRVTVI